MAGLWPLLAMVGVASADFVPGSVCNLRDESTNARLLLRGKHLKIGDISWAPFGSRTQGWEAMEALPRYDGNQLNGYIGFDVDLIIRLSQILGFTFEIFHINGPNMTADETWSDVLLREVPKHDLILSYWTHTIERRELFEFLLGHIDYSTYLIARKSVRMHVPFSGRITTFLDPFTINLWIAVLALIIVSGIVSYFIERSDNGQLSESIFLYFAGDCT